jgi:hypothetical protein
MQRYRPEIAIPNTGKPWPIMAEDSQEGEYYHRAEVDPALAEFVRMQHELCQLLGCDEQTDSIALHDRIVQGIRRLQR